jgi:hypothetical protein
VNSRSAESILENISIELNVMMEAMKVKPVSSPLMAKLSLHF